jgi:rod shape determining protein RodA
VGNQSLPQRMHIDLPLILGLLALCSLGLVILYSASGMDRDVVFNQGGKIALAFGLMLLFAQIPPAQLARWSLWVYLAGVVLLVAVLIAGDVSKGARRWLDLGIVRFQPSELMKLAVPMFAAWYISERSIPPGIASTVAVCALVLVPVLLIGKQPDLGTALLVGVAGFTVLFVAGISWRLLGGLALGAALSSPVVWYFMNDYQHKRVFTFLDPEQDPLGAGYHIIQSMIAIGSGGLYGKGWLNGTQSHLEFLPERSTDFIFSVYCEEFGFMGVLLLCGLYLFVIGRGLYLALNAQEAYGRLLGAGLVLTFFVYIFVNMGMVMGQLPVVGVPLPLISQGGTALVTLMTGFGMLMSIHSHRRLLSG